MLKTINLLLPVVMPSWRFFEAVAPSPRIEFALLNTPQESPDAWQEFRPRPAKLPVSIMLKRLFWNAHWNESLFLVSCAERLMQNPTEHSVQEIVKRIKIELQRNAIVAAPYFQFRLIFVDREGTQLQKHVTFISEVFESDIS